MLPPRSAPRAAEPRARARVGAGARELRRSGASAAPGDAERLAPAGSAEGEEGEPTASAKKAAAKKAGAKKATAKKPATAKKTTAKKAARQEVRRVEEDGRGRAGGAVPVSAPATRGLTAHAPRGQPSVPRTGSGRGSA